MGKKNSTGKFSTSSLKYLNEVAVKNWALSFNAINDCIIILLPDSIIEDINDAGLKLFRTNRESVVSKDCKDLIKNFHKSSDNCVLCDALKHDEPSQNELYSEIFNKWFLINVTPIKNNEGDIIKFICHIQDITNAKIHEEEIIKAKNSLIKAEQIALIGHWEMNLNTKNVKASDGAKKIYGFENNPDELTKEIIQTIPLKEYRESLDKALIDLITNNTPYNVDFKIVRNNDQSIRDIHSEAEYLPESNIVFGIIKDITKQKKTEEFLLKQNEEINKAKKKIEESDYLKTVFLNNMSHEIRTPMNGIIGFAELLNEPDISTDKRTYYSKIIQNSSYQLLRIIDDILEISTLETKHVKIVKEKFCLNDLLMELHSVFNLQAERFNLNIYLKKELSDKDSGITTDKSKLNKILTNIIENAIKYTKEGFIEIGYFVNDDFITIYVKDTGIGITTENQEFIFQRFSQERSQAVNDNGVPGLGLGLSIAKENANLLGGDIRLQSNPGEGSTFYIDIPFESEKIDQKKATILVVEDSSINFFFIESILVNNYNQTHKVIQAKNGKEAIKICSEDDDISLILMDIKMPVIDGNEATKIIKESKPNLPIIAQTAYSTDEDKNKALQNGFDEFISKPIEKEKLLKIISKYIV